MSNAVQWTSIYDVKIDIFNEHHKQLFNIINQLFSDLDKGSKNNAATDLAFIELSDYMQLHFGQEEEFMRLHNYPEKDFNEHIEQHKLFIDRVTELHHNFIYKHYSVTVDLLLFLQSWLITHIMTTDKKYTAFFKQKGII